MKQYLDLCHRIIEDGIWVENKRTNSRVKTVINADFTYDCDQGKFPILTTRKSFYKSAIGELLGYLNGCTDAQVFKDKYKTPTWFANANENEVWVNNPHRKGENDMGQAYRFRKKIHYVEVKENFKVKPDTQYLPKFDKLVCDYSSNIYGLVGKLCTSTNHGKFKVIKETNTQTPLVDIQFEKTGYIKRGVTNSMILDGLVDDPYYPSILGIACEGEGDKSDADYDMLYQIWDALLNHCYGTPTADTDNTFVSDEWLVFANFMNDVKSLPNWYLKKVFPEEYVIEKDIHNSNYYAKETCRWCTITEQSMNAPNVITYQVTKNNKEFIIKSNSSLFSLLGDVSHLTNDISKIKEGDEFNYSDYKIKVMPYNKFCYIESDQVRSIYAKLKCGYDDRGLIMNAWHEELEPYSCLRPCMYEHQFSLLDGILYLNSTQRSVDVPLGLAFNQIQVYTLLVLMAQLTGHKPGKAYHKLINAHIYENQLEVMQQVQLQRDPLPLPSLEINPNIKTLQDIETWVTPDDFKIYGYQHHPPINYPFAV